ncbi:MAG TPA: hypothetical protein VI408_14375 [Gaiellaceae bacterium]
MALGPGWTPPQGARALVGAILGGDLRSGPAVAGTLVEREPGVLVFWFHNEGRATAVDLRFLYRDEDGGVVRREIGNLAPGASSSERLDHAPAEPFEALWVCRVRHGHLRVWAYDGRVSRLRRRDIADGDIFGAVYG